MCVGLLKKEDIKHCERVLRVFPTQTGPDCEVLASSLVHYSPVPPPPPLAGPPSPARILGL